MPTANVRIDIETHEVLKRLAEQEKEPMQSILAKAIERYRRARFLDGANADFAALKKRPKDWQSYLAEREAWDSTLEDGLKE
ncbi:MAG: toxin-antitoxin system protein [Acidobacteriota bacterium]